MERRLDVALAIGAFQYGLGYSRSNRLRQLDTMACGDLTGDIGWLRQARGVRHVLHVIHGRSLTRDGGLMALTTPRCYDCLSEDVTVKVIDEYGFEHWFCAEDWAAGEKFREAVKRLLARV